MTLTDRISARLAATGLKMAQASKKADLGATYVRDLIKGRVENPRTEHLARLADVLGTTVEWLVEGRGEEAPSREALEYARLQAMLRRIAPEDLPGAERALKGFVRESEPLDFDAEPAKPAKKRKRP